jgi:adenylyl cyclase-associated protein
LVLEKVERNQVVNVFGCKNTVIQVKGKVNAISMSRSSQQLLPENSLNASSPANCQKTSLLVDSVISSVSITNSGSFALQVTGIAPTIQVDATDSGQIFLSKSCLGVEIITAKCSAINVSLPVEGEEDGIFAEKPIPEVFRTVVHNGKLVTNILEHNG